MHPKKNIRIVWEGDVYSFIVDLQSQSLDAILKVEEGDSVELMVSMYDVPDRVQIDFYHTLRKLIYDYQQAGILPDQQ